MKGDYKSALKGEAKLFAFNHWNLIIFFVMLISVLLLYISLCNSFISTNEKTSTDEEYAKYREELVLIDEFIDFYERGEPIKSNRIPPVAPNTKEAEIYVGKLKLQISIYEMYFRTNTTNYDYLKITDPSFLQLFSHAPIKNLFAAHALNLSFVGSTILAIFGAILGAIKGIELFGANARVRCLGSLNRRSLFAASETFGILKLLFFTIFTVIYALILCLIAKNTSCLIIFDNSFLVCNVTIIVLEKILSAFIFGVFAYSLMLFFMSLFDKPIYGFLATLCTLGALYYLGSIITDTYAMRPFFGALFSSTGFINISTIYNIPLLIIAVCFLYYYTRKNYIKKEF